MLDIPGNIQTLKCTTTFSIYNDTYITCLVIYKQYSRFLQTLDSKIMNKNNKDYQCILNILEQAAN